MRHRSLLRRSLLLLVWLLGCAADPTELGPSEALTAFLSALERSTHAPEQRKLAYEWLDQPSRALLAERARLSSSLAGRTYEPWEMLVPGRSSFAAQSIAGVRLRARIEGEHASVEVPGKGDAPQREVKMVREQGRWRVVLRAAD